MMSNSLCIINTSQINIHTFYLTHTPTHTCVNIVTYVYPDNQTYKNKNSLQTIKTNHTKTNIK